MRNDFAVAAVVVACLGLSSMAVAADGPASRPVFEAPKLGDEVIDAAMVKVARQSELAVVQIGKFKELAAKLKKDAGAAATQESDSARWNRRERLSWTVADILYPDQLDLFLTAYEEQLGSPSGDARKMARLRLGQILGSLESPLSADQRVDMLWSLIQFYLPVCKERGTLAAAYKDRLSDAKAAAEFRQKDQALVRATLAKSLEIVNGQLTPELQKAVAGEWLRRQDRRAYMALKDLGRVYAPKTDEQKKRVDALNEAFRKASRTLDLEGPEYPELVKKLEKDLAAALAP